MRHLYIISLFAVNDIRRIDGLVSYAKQKLHKEAPIYHLTVSSK